jgi:hypothetical protein
VILLSKGLLEPVIFIVEVDTINRDSGGGNLDQYRTAVLLL